MPLQKITIEEIIAASIRVFRRKGYYRTSISDLAKETGLTKGVFYHHFTNKEEIMKTALKSLCSYFDYKVFSIAYDQSIPPPQRLQKMVEIYWKAITKEPGGCFFANTILETAQNEDTFLSEAKAFFDKWKDAMAQVFKDAGRAGDAELIAEEIINDIEGALILTQLNKDMGYLKRAMERNKNRL